MAKPAYSNSEVSLQDEDAKKFPVLDPKELNSLNSIFSTLKEATGGTSILGGRGAWPQNFKFVSDPQFLLQKYRRQIPQILPFEFQI